MTESPSVSQHDEIWDDSKSAQIVPTKMNDADVRRREPASMCDAAKRVTLDARRGIRIEAAGAAGLLFRASQAPAGRSLYFFAGIFSC